MKTKVLFLLAITCLLSITIQAQRGVRIGYIDTEYILQNVPEYQDATSQLDAKVLKWKGEIETKLGTIEQRRKDLSNEKALLTKELIEEREEDIAFEEKEILDYQQKRFGPNGDLMIQKKQLIQPIQDQIFAAVQTIATNKKYDFVFDKSADVVMLFSAKRFDMSELVLRSLTRASKRDQAKTKAERRKAEKEDVVPVINEKLEERQKATDKRKKEILDAREAKKKAALERREKILEDRAKAKQAKLDVRKKGNEDSEEKTPLEEENEDSKKAENEEDSENKTPEQLAEDAKQQKLNDREARKKALEERKQKVLAEREAARQKKLADRKKAKEDRENNDQENEEENN